MTAPLNRTTSTYRVEVAGSSRAGANTICDYLVERCPVTVMSSGIDQHKAFLHFRAPDDAAALAIASQTAGNLPRSLTTGYGVNLRAVTEEASP